MKRPARGGQQSWPDDLQCLKILKIDEVLGKFASVDRYLNDLVEKNAVLAMVLIGSFLAPPGAL